MSFTSEFYNDMDLEDHKDKVFLKEMIQSIIREEKQYHKAKKEYIKYHKIAYDQEEHYRKAFLGGIRRLMSNLDGIWATVEFHRESMRSSQEMVYQYEKIFINTLLPEPSPKGAVGNP